MSYMTHASEFSTGAGIQDLNLAEIDNVNGALSWGEVGVIALISPVAGAVVALWKIGYDGAHNRANRES